MSYSTRYLLKHAFDILEAPEDDREKLQAMELFKYTHLVKMELLSNTTTIDSALSYIRNKQQGQQQKKLQTLGSSSDDNSNNDYDEEPPKAGNQTVF